MSKTRDTGYLANVIQVHDTGVRIMSGSTMLMAVSSSGAVTITGEISGSDAANALLLSGTGSVGFTTTSSFLAVSSSQQQVSASYIALSGSYTTFSGSVSTRITTISSSQQDISSSLLQVSASLLQVSASYTALSGSYNVFSGSASTRITVDSASLLQVSSSQQQISSSLLNVISIFATTGSNSFRATQSITGSLTVTGQIIAQTLNVQQVTSSIIYSSGSNNFGCDLNSRQTFTGSVLITGSLTIAGASSATSYSGTTIFGSTIACSPIGCFATSCATSFIGGTLSGTTIYGSTAVCSPVGKFTSCLGVGHSPNGYILDVCGAQRTIGSLTINEDGAGTKVLTVRSDWAGVDPAINVTTNNCLLLMTNNTVRVCLSNTGVATFTCQVCAPAFIGGTLSGTTIYGSTAVCSPVGKFTSCIDVGGTGTFSGNVGVGASILNISGYAGKILTIGNGLQTENAIELYSNASVDNILGDITWLNAASTCADKRLSIIRANRSGANDSSSMNFYIKNAGTFVNALTLASTGASTFSSTITGTTIYGSTAVCSAVGLFSGCVGIGSTSNVGKLDINTGGNTNVVISNDSTDTGYNIVSLNGTRTKGSYVGIAGGGTGDSNLYLNSAGGVIVQTGASYTQRLTITSTGAATFNGCATFSCTAQFSKIQKHPTGYWYKIPFSVSKNTNVGTASTFCMVNITSDNSFNEMFIYVEYASRLQAQSDQQTQVSSRMYGINRFNSGTIAVTNSYTLVGGAGCVIDTHAPITAVAVGTCTIVVKVDFSTCTSYSSFVWGEIRVYSIENLNPALTIPYNEW